MAGSAIPREAWQTGAVVGGPSHVDTLGPLRYVTVMEAGSAVVDGALVHDNCKQDGDAQVRLQAASVPSVLHSVPRCPTPGSPPSFPPRSCLWLVFTPNGHSAWLSLSVLPLGSVSGRCPHHISITQLSLTWVWRWDPAVYAFL